MWPVAVSGLLLFLAGLSAYAGYGKPIIVTMWPKPYLSFGVAWLGLSALFAAVGNPLMDSGFAIPGTLLILLGLVCFVIMLLSFFWLPRVLLPGWYKNWVDGGRSVLEVSQWPKFGRGGRS
ncbi:hypothetical protein OG474_24490 [Kribbella sp. NBC_01505]|uniref:hypothetical protein n=1 Tax=Kribbella sp. NBC_01505 TaxID=2903580 RepID=UPI00386B27EF